jgi:hypothetical protein
MSWKDEVKTEIDDQKKYIKYIEDLLKDVNQRMFFDELAIRALIKIITIDQKFVSPKQYTTIIDQVYSELMEEHKKRQIEAALKEKETASETKK